MADKLRWGILATGNIAHKFATGLAASKTGVLAAVGSRTQESADKFGDEFSIPRRHGSYEALAADDEVDAIYVSTPHPMHKDNAILCLRAGKAVLCEKPMAINARESEEMIAVARETGCFLMEAMWTRFLPPIVRLREMLASGAIGEVRMVMADFGFRAGENPEGRLFKLSMGGGGLLDVGIYPIALASMILGKAKDITGLAHIGDTGVDEQAAMTLGYDGGGLAVLACGVRTQMTHEASIFGTDGLIRLAHGWWHGSAITLQLPEKEPEIIDLPVEGNGYHYEADEVARCLAAGKTESDVMPLAETVEIAQTMDTLRAQWGLKYPME